MVAPLIEANKMLRGSMSSGFGTKTLTETVEISRNRIGLCPLAQCLYIQTTEPGAISILATNKYPYIEFIVSVKIPQNMRFFSLRMN